MTARTGRLLLALGAFVAGLVLFSAVIFIVTGRTPVPISAAAVGGPFQLVDQTAMTGRTGEAGAGLERYLSWCGGRPGLRFWEPGLTLRSSRSVGGGRLWSTNWVVACAGTHGGVALRRNHALAVSRQRSALRWRR